MQKAYYFTGTDDYSEWTDNLIKAKPDLSTTEKRLKKKTPNNNKKPQQTSYAHNYNGPENFWNLGKPMPETELWFEKWF